LRLETNNLAAIDALNKLLEVFIKPDRKLFLVSDAGIEDTEQFTISTTYYRGLLYNIEHTVHHMALIRVGLQELTDISLPSGFGIAFSTLKHRKQVCAR
jgi:hypothetical protein